MEDKKKKPSSKTEKKDPRKRATRKKQVRFKRTPEEAEVIRALVVIPETEEQRIERERLEQEAENDRVHDMLERQAKAFGMTYDRAGRPSKFTEATVQKILTAIAIGATFTESANYAGITKQTLYNYFTQFPHFETLCESMRTKTPLKARRITNYYFDQIIKQIERKEEIDPDCFKLAYGFLRDKYPREFSKGIGGGMLGNDDEAMLVAPQVQNNVTNNTVNMIFSNTLGKSQFLKDVPIPKE